MLNLTITGKEPRMGKTYLTEEQIQDIINTGGDRNKIIINYIPMVRKIARQFPKKYLESNEACGMALLALVQCVNNVKQSTGMSKYIYKSVYNTLRKYCSRHMDRSPITTYNKQYALKRVNLGKDNEPRYTHYFNLDLDEVIDKITMNNKEKIFVILLMEGGYTQIEIAKQLDLSNAFASRLREKLLKRLEKELE